MIVSEEMKAEFRSKSPLKEPTDEIVSLLKELYLDKHLSQVKISKLFGVQTYTIGKWLNRCNIPLRDRYDAVSLHLSKDKNYPFSGNLSEKAYLIGIRTGDLSAQMHGRKIRLSVSTTHPAMLNLFEQLFKNYSNVKFYPKYDRVKNRYLTCVYCNLDDSFEFLIPKLTNIPGWILENDEYSISFLSGYFDAEGCISIDKNRNIQFIIKSCDKGILDDLSNKLKLMNINLNLKLAKKADYKTYNMDYWYFGTGKRQTINKLLKLMKIKHAEKILKSKLLAKEFSVSNVIELRKHIKADIESSMIRAEVEYLHRHPSSEI